MIGIPKDPSPDNKTNTDKSTFKQSNPVKICVGDTVTYKITVYNNSKVDSGEIKLKDNTTDWNIIDTANIKVYDSDGNIIYSDFGKTYKNPEKLCIKLDNIAAGQSKDIYVDFKYIKDSDNKIERNEIQINETTKSNKTNYRTYDGDAVVFEHSVSLEKFVSNVYSPGTKESVDYTAARAGKRYNREAKANDSENHNDYKPQNPVIVEKGDLITYTIRLKNTGLNPVKVTAIYDEHDKELSFKSISCKNEKYKNIKRVAEFEINDNLVGSKYTCANAGLLDAGEVVDIEVVFEINTDDASKNFLNRAKIEYWENENNHSVNDSDGPDNNQDEDYVKPKAYKVSLEKFVTKVQSPVTGDSVELKNNVTNEWTRAGKRYNVALLNKPDKQTRENFNTYKVEKENVVSLENGDDITFTIRLSNTGNNKVKITKIDDWHSSELTLKNKKTDKYSAKTIDDGTGKDPHEEITFKNPVLLDPDKYVDIQIIYNIKAEKNNTKEDFYNKAKINELQNKNNCKAWDCDGPDNNQDEDHVKLKKYKVSLEKYVTEVTDANEGNKQTYTDREYKRYNESAGTAANKDGFKKSQAVQLEAGDLVTFTIKIKNEDTTEREKNTDIYVKKITDIPISKNKDNSLEYLENSIGATVIKNKDGSLTVKLPDKNGEKISAQQCYTFTMTFKVNVSTINTQTVQDFSNKAKVTNIYNKNTLEVNDSDGADNNADEDFIKTKVYTVSLEKYIEKVVLSNREVKDGFNREGLAEHKYNKDLEGYKDDTLPTPGEKYNNVVKADCGSKITYVIKIKNDGDTKVRITGVQDYLPAETTMYQLDSYTEKNSVYDKYNRRIYIVNLNDTERKEKGYYTSDASNDQDNKAINSYNRNGIELEPGGTKEFKVTITTKASNLSLDVYRNEAQLNYIENRNKLKVMDTTPKDNKDRDYFKMDSPTKTPIDICVHKVWENVSEREIPNRITVRLKNKKTGAEVKNATLNKDNGWRVVWTDLDKDIEYDVTEDTVAGFNKKIVKKSEYEYEITNTKKDTPSPEKTSVYVEKKWSDSDNKYGKRPNSVEVALYQDGKQYNNLVKTLSASNSWNGNWENLPKFDNNDGHEYKYTVQELNKSSGYETSIEQISKQGYSIAFKITNKYTGKETEKVSKTVTKIWDDDNEKYEDRPTSIKVGLYANGNETGKTATLNSSNSWTYIWNDLEKYSDGQEIVYTVKEIGKINNYIVKYDSNTECDTITNIYNKTHISVYKEWDVQDQSLIKPVNVTLYRNGTALSTAELNEDNSWNHTWDNLDVYDNNLNKYTYTIQETTLLENIESCIRGSGDKYTIINKQIDDEDPIIAGIVWNDIAFDKLSSYYNAIYDQDKNESLLKDIKVYLYRNGVNNAVAETTTDSNGYYCFRNIDLKNVDSTEKYIKAKVNSTTDNKWNKTSGYYSYTVVFEYDGIKYTSTFDSAGNRKWGIDKNITTSQYAKSQYSNAEEDLGVRKNFNINFATIDNTKGITYETINEADNLPQSRYVYNSEMAMTSSTDTIKIEDYKDKELTLQHINLGLRGRDTLDLELTSDVSSIDVTVNEQTGTYKYNNNVTIRRNDIKRGDRNVLPDAANIVSEEREATYGKLDQKVRKTDITNDNYAETGLGIKVTYKITVLNAGVTNATATKIVNYYDNRYKFVSAKYDGNELLSENINGGTGYNGRLIKTNGDMLTNGKSMDIYVTYELNEPETLLKDLDINDKLPTYNMAEIYEYKSECANGQSEYTRGLIDVDSAPGSANTEKARLTNGEGNVSTAQYLFNAKNAKNVKNEEELLKLLRCEDDTYSTPVLYFVIDGGERKLSGNVFEDLTTLYANNVKSGNGKKEEDVEINVYKATVQLVENGVVRFTETTDDGGNYTFKGFLPGNYTVKFTYGNNDETVIINATGNGMNKKSFNGEDYQATNNTGTYGSNKISSRNNYWYLDNESQGISTATDDPTQRLNVSNYMYNNYPIMETLNYIRDGATKETCGPRGTGTETTNGSKYVNEIEENTFMFANTKNMLIGVEKAFLDGDEVKQSNSFNNYEIKNINFGIAEVPVSTVDLQKHVAGFKIVDSAGVNTIAEIELQEDNKSYNIIKGDVLQVGVNHPIDVSIENEKLQGAKLTITYKISAQITVEKNFDGTESVKPTIKGLYDFIDNNLEYNNTLGDNSKYWKMTSYNEMKNNYDGLYKKGDSVEPASTVAKNETSYNVIIEATGDNPLLKLDKDYAEVDLVLEKVLSSNDSGIEEIVIKETQNMFGYLNKIEIKQLDYNSTDTGNPLRDRVRTPDRYIIIPGKNRDNATSEEIVIHPPTGDGGAIGITYYIVGLASLCILAIGVFGIKKFIIKR